MKAVVISLHILLLSCQCEGFNLCKHQTQLSKVVLIPRCLCYPCTTHSLSLWQAWLNETSLFCATTVRTKAFVLSHTSQNWDVNAELLWFAALLSILASFSAELCHLAAFISVLLWCQPCPWNHIWTARELRAAWKPSVNLMVLQLEIVTVPFWS